MSTTLSALHSEGQALTCCFGKSNSLDATSELKGQVEVRRSVQRFGVAAVRDEGCTCRIHFQSRCISRQVHFTLNFCAFRLHHVQKREEKDAE